MCNPNLVTDADCEEFLTVKEKGWFCEIDNLIVGFAIAYLKKNTIWVLFLKSKFEKKGIGQTLHKIMLDWYFNQTKDNVWLGTSFNTRAEQFSKKVGWIEIGTYGNKEIKFEMTFESWQQTQTIT